LCSDGVCSGPLVCRAGQCTDKTDPDPTACELQPPFALVRAGDDVTFSVHDTLPQPRLDDNSRYAWHWSSTDGGPTLDEVSYGNYVVDLPSIIEPGNVKVEATLGQAKCHAEIQVLGPNDPATFLRVVAVDQITGRPVEGAVVQVEHANTTKTTASDGTAQFTVAELGSAPNPFTVSVFHQAYGYVTWIGPPYGISSFGPDIRIELLRNPTDLQGGVKGRIQNLFDGTSDVHIGLAGFAQHGDLTLNLSNFVGPQTSTSVLVGAQSRDFEVPQGSELGLAGDQFKADFTALGAPAACVDQTEPCGKGTFWTLGGDLPLDQLPVDNLFSLPSGLNANLDVILAGATPSLNNWHESITHDQVFPLGPPVDGGFTVDPQNLTSVETDLRDGGVGLSVKTAISIPPLPALDARSGLSDAVVLASATVAGRGLVPLSVASYASITRFVDGGFDPNVNHTGLFGPSSNGVLFNIAPESNGLEGEPVVLTIVATNDLLAGPPNSGIVTPLSTCDISADGYCDGSQIIPVDGFLAVPQPGNYSQIKRHYLAPPKVSSSAMLRLGFSDQQGRRWDIFSPWGNIDVPVPPSGVTDRVGQSYVVEALELQDPLGPSDQFSMLPLGHLDSYVARFSTMPGVSE
jgi:hypothetical protein